MARQIIDTTTNNGSYIGDPAKTAFEKTNANFGEIYNVTVNLTPFSGGYSSSTWLATGAGGSIGWDDRAEGAPARWLTFVSNGVWFLFYTPNGSTPFTVNRNGTASAPVFNQTSSADVKDYIEGFSGDACDELNRLAVITYKFRPEFLVSDKTYVGILTENLESIRPDAVSEPSHYEEIDFEVGVDGKGSPVYEKRRQLIPMGYDMAQLMAINIRSHQQKSKKIKDLEQAILALSNRLDAAGI